MLTPGDESAFGWIERADGLPRVFERTTCILHAMWEDLSISDQTLTWNRWEEESGAKYARLERDRQKGGIRAAMADAESTGRLRLVAGSTLPNAPLRRITWREIAKRHDLDLSLMVERWAIWRSFSALGGVPRYLVGTDREGEIDAGSAARLVEVIRRIEGEVSCWVHFFAGLDGSWSRQTPFVLQGSLAEIGDLIAARVPEGGRSPDFWWPEDRRWCVYTDYDSTVTWVGGSAELVSAIEGDSMLETAARGHHT